LAEPSSTTVSAAGKSLAVTTGSTAAVPTIAVAIALQSPTPSAESPSIVVVQASGGSDFAATPLGTGGATSTNGETLALSGAALPGQEPAVHPSVGTCAAGDLSNAVVTDDDGPGRAANARGRALDSVLQSGAVGLSWNGFRQWSDLAHSHSSQGSAKRTKPIGTIVDAVLAAGWQPQPLLLPPSS
jgi:hypothetical protein